MYWRNQFWLRSNKYNTHMCLCLMSWSSSLVYWLEDREVFLRFPAGSRDVSLLQSPQTRCGAPCWTDNWGSFPGTKQPVDEADHSPPFSTDFQNVWNCTSTSLHPFMVRLYIYMDITVIVETQTSQRTLQKQKIRLDVHESVLRDTIMKVTNKMQPYRLIYFSLSALHVSGDVFAHHQEH